jgi:integrase
MGVGLVDRQLKRRMELGPAWAEQGFDFTNTTGGTLAVNVLEKRFRILIDVAGVPRIQFHDLRHTCATLMLANGEHPKVVRAQRRRDHAQPLLPRHPRHAARCR